MKIKKCFIISNTSKRFNKSFYLTPIRESKKAFYCGAVVFENKISEEIAKKIDGRVDYVYVDLEKKISNKKTKSVIEDMPPSILILFSDLKFMDYFPGASRMSINSIDAPSML